MLADCAWQPRELGRRLRSVSLPDEAARDLESGDYLFGRGVMDMKFGIALHLELLRQAAESGRLSGNILFLSVPDDSYFKTAAWPHFGRKTSSATTAVFFITAGQHSFVIYIIL